jgi:hypothetical protein
MWRGAAPACALLALTAGPAAAQDPGPNLFTTIGITSEETRDNSGIRGPYSLQAEDMPPSRSVLAPEDDVTDDVPLRMPDTSGNLPNLAAFEGQALALAADDRKAYTRIHFFGMTADGSGGGDFLLTYTDGSTQTVTVSFPDWCQSGHWAIGPGDGRWTPTGSDTAPCGIFHVPAEIDEGKTLASVQLPPETDAGGNTVAYLMALTLELPDGSFELPDLSGRAPCVDEDVAPVTTHAFSPAAPNGNDGWYAGAVRATLSATDEEGGSGVEQVLYRLDGGRARPYGGVLTLDADGPHTFEYRAIDCAGNAEEFKSVDLKVDAHAPSTAARLTPRTPLGPGGWYDGAVAVALTARDGDGSGTDVTEYRLDGGSWTAYDGALEIGAVGRHVLEYRSTDVAGNVEPARALDVNVDATAPRTGVLVNGAPAQAAYTGAVRVAFVRTDADGSGVAATEYRLDGGAWTAYAGAFDVVTAGDHRVDYRSRDVVGNTEPYRTLQFSLSAPAGASGTPPSRPAPFAALAPVARNRSTVAALRRGRLVVRVSCRSVRRGTVTLTVTRATARRLGLGSRVLVRAAVRCGAQGRAAVRLRPSRKVRRALARSRRAVEAGLTLRMRGASPDETSLVLRRG